MSNLLRLNTKDFTYIPKYKSLISELSLLTDNENWSMGNSFILKSHKTGRKVHFRCFNYIYHFGKLEYLIYQPSDLDLRKMNLKLYFIRN